MVDQTNNWLNYLLGLPLLPASVFMFSPTSHNVSLTIIWSMTGIVIGFYISYSDSEEELNTILNIIGIQIAMFDQINMVQKTLKRLKGPQLVKNIAAIITMANEK